MWVLVFSLIKNTRTNFITDTVNGQDLCRQEGGPGPLSDSPKLLPITSPLPLLLPLHLLFPLPGRLRSLIGSFSPFLSLHKWHSLLVASLTHTHLTPFHHYGCQESCSRPIPLSEDVQSKLGPLPGRVVPGIVSIHEELPKAEKGEHVVRCLFTVLPGLRAGQETGSREAWLSSQTLQAANHPWQTGSWSLSEHRHQQHTAARSGGSGFERQLFPLLCCVSRGKGSNLSVPTYHSKKQG